jgi:serine-type D-Ala-D-Ala carboxypeptidase
VSLDETVSRLLRAGITPGLTLLVGRSGRPILHRQAGLLARRPLEEPLVADALYDLASLTKPLVTAFLAARLHECGQLDLQRPVNAYLSVPTWPCTVEQLLTHTAGLPPWHPFYLYPASPREQAAMFRPATKPGRRVVYSCVGYILLKEILEQVSGQSFRTLANEVIFAPLRLHDAGLAPVAAGDITRTAPTERGNGHERAMCQADHARAAASYPWRTGIIRGQTHDLNSHHSGGSAGNAGLFASAAALLRLSGEFFPQTATLLKPETVRLFWQPRAGSRRCVRTIGFQLNTPGSSGGRVLSSAAIGHSGFTGTSLWMEPDATVWIILTNRVHPTVQPVNFNAVRRRLHAAMKREIERMS